ncbi:MAG TPA: DNA cytosine methyltransferase [Brevundimonas sp.]|jgi:DNA (cytosine-5)-methyltransferase 1|uniref:DNA cytosine methyltransferase n=1 Tax=Brevundimonas sp. TaxID=1871086 RepID=UPI002DE97707|nr:DNA cytosine methyltransferase [Brevundimonas sp.]
MTNQVSSNAPTAWEFFAGGGLAGLGLDGWRVGFANDLDAAKARAFRANHPDVPFHEGDVGALTPADLPGSADLAWASSPCQDLSLAGARGGLAGRRSGAFWGFMELMRGLEAEGRAPDRIVVENVCGLLTSGGGADFAAVCAALGEGGRRVGALEIDAAHWLPQSRPRLFVVAVRGDAPPEIAGPVAPFHSARLVAAHDRLPDAVKASWAWWSLAAPPRRNLDLAGMLEPDDRVAWFSDERTKAALALLSPLHRRRLEAERASGGRRTAAGYRRVRIEDGVRTQRLELRFDGMAGCLRTPAGGSSRQIVVVVDGGRTRLRWLTPVEAARLMGVPDAYRLPASASAGLKLMGDAVAVPVVRALADGLLAPGAGRRAAA